MTSVT